MKLVHRTLAAVLLATWLSACGSLTLAPEQPTPGSFATAAPMPVDPVSNSQMPKDVNQIKAQVQSVLDKYMQAMNSADLQGLAEVVDQENLTFKRVQNELLESKVYSWKGRNPQGTVSDVKFVKESYVKVWLKDTVRGEHVWIFKWTGTGWLVSEPSEEELGPKKNWETDTFVVRYFEWDEPHIDAMVKAIEESRRAAINSTGRKPKDKFLVRLAPTFETHAGRAGIGVAANYNSSGNFLAIRSPESFGGTFSGIGDAKSVPDIHHELIHLLVHEATTPKAPHLWLNEGFAYYFTGDLRASTVKASLSQKVYGIKELTQLRVDEFGGEQTDRFILAQSTVLVQYMVERFGGRDKAWEWMIEETRIRDFNESLQKVLGVSLDQFERGWHDFMRQKYG